MQLQIFSPPPPPAPLLCMGLGSGLQQGLSKCVDWYFQSYALQGRGGGGEGIAIKAQEV